MCDPFNAACVCSSLFFKVNHARVCERVLYLHFAHREVDPQREPRANEHRGSLSAYQSYAVALTFR